MSSIFRGSHKYDRIFMFWNSTNSCIVFDAVKLLKTCDKYSKIIQIIKRQNEKKKWKFYVTLAKKKYKQKQQH